MCHCKENLEIIPFNNENLIKAFIIKLGYIDNLNTIYHNISRTFYRYFNDYNINNYIICHIYTVNPEYDDILYNTYHKEYYKYYEKNPDTKIIIWTNDKELCKINFKFFNVFYIYYKYT